MSEKKFLCLIGFRQVFLSVSRQEARPSMCHFIFKWWQVRLNYVFFTEFSLVLIMFVILVKHELDQSKYMTRFSIFYRILVSYAGKFNQSFWSYALCSLGLACHCGVCSRFFNAEVVGVSISKNSTNFSCRKSPPPCFRRRQNKGWVKTLAGGPSSPSSNHPKRSPRCSQTRNQGWH